METDVEGLSRGWKQMLRDSHGDGSRCRGCPMGMETDDVGVPWGWKQMSRESHGMETDVEGVP